MMKEQKHYLIELRWFIYYVLRITEYTLDFLEYKTKVETILSYLNEIDTIKLAWYVQHTMKKTMQNNISCIFGYLQIFPTSCKAVLATVTIIFFHK